MNQPLGFVSGLVRRLNRITHARPRLGLRLASAAGVALGLRLGESWCPSAAELEEVLGPMERRRLQWLRRRMAAGELRNRALMYLIRHSGSHRLAPLIRIRGAEGLQRLRDAKVPVAVTFWHLGVIRAVETALANLGVAILSSTDQVPRGADPGYRWIVVTDPASGARFVMEALREMQAGGVPVLALDGPGGKRRVPFFGRSVPLPAGVGALAGRGGARIVPATSRWIGLSSGVEVTFHDPLPEPEGATPDEREGAMLDTAAAWFEAHVRAHPEDLRLASARYLIEHLRSHDRAPRDEDFARLVDAFEAEDGP